MRILSSKQGILGICLALWFLPATSHAEIYKWVDADGQMHYSEYKEDAEMANVNKLKIESPPPSAQNAAVSQQSWLEQERSLEQHQLQKKNEMLAPSPLPIRPQSLSGGTEDGTDASRCALARDILNGAVHHANGAPIDEYDRQVAENDVQSFCH